MEKTESKKESAVAVVEPAAAPAKGKESTPAFKAPKKKRKWIKRLIILVVLAVVAVFVFKGCTGGQSGAASSAYIPAAAANQDLVVSVTGTGTIEPIHSYKVTTLIKGEVLEAPFEEGQELHKGDLLFRIDSKDVENSIQQLELSLQTAKLNYNELLKQQGDNQKDRSIKANATGIVTKLYVDPGDSVTVGTPIADLLDRDNMKLTVPFHAVNAAAFYLGQSATVQVDGTIDTITGVIDSIAATDDVGPGGTLVRKVTIRIQNPGAIADTSTGTAKVGGIDCASGATFEYATAKQLVAKSSGEIETLSIDENDRVTDGQTVGVFKDVDMATQIENAKISIENAQLNLQNARDKLEDYSITSTIDGTVIEKNFDVGDNIDATGASASSVTYPAVIYDLSALTFDIKIDELDISKLAVGQQVEITADALEGKSFTGRVDKVNINGTTQSGVTTYPVTVKVDGGADELYPGMNVSAKIIVEDAGAVLCIPVEAVQRGNQVYVAGAGALDETGKLINPAALELRDVTVGRNDSEHIEVLSGLTDGENVYIPNAASNAMAMMMGG